MRAAAKAYYFVSGTMRERDRLAHAWRNGASAGPALATDYSSMINAAVALYLATGDNACLSDAVLWAEQLHTWHSDGRGGYYLASADRSDLIIRARSDQDEAIPSATAMTIEALARLGQIAHQPELTRRAETALAAAWGRIQANPFASAGIVNAADTLLRAPKLVITGPDTSTLRESAMHQPDPARLDLSLSDPKEILRHVGTTGGQKPGNFAYLCRGPVCLPPISDAKELDRLLSEPVRT